MVLRGGAFLVSEVPLEGLGLRLRATAVGGVLEKRLAALQAQGAADTDQVCPILPNHTVDYSPFIKTQPASRNQLWDLVKCNFGHVILESLRQQNPLTPPCDPLALCRSCHRFPWN